MSGRYEEIAERYLEPAIRGSSEFMCRCPFCSGSASLQYNIDNGLWVCFKCDAKGNAKSLVRRMGGVYSDPAVSVEYLYQQLDRLKLIKKRQQNEKERIFPDSTLLRYNFPDPYWHEIRGFSKATIKKWGLGYDPIKDRNTIPYRNLSGELLGVIERLRDPNIDIRYIYPDAFDRKGSLFGSWHVNGLRKFALLEGSTDVIALDDANRPGVAQYGSTITDAQARLLHRLGAREVVLFYDYDEAGRKAIEKSQEKLRGLVLRVAIYNTEHYCWHKKMCGCGEHTWRTIGKCQKKRLCKCGRKHEMDPGSLPKKERRRMYDEASLIGTRKVKVWRTGKYA